MPMLLIVGSFRIVGAAPDGDSVRFYPDEPQDWDLVEGEHQVRRNSAGGAQLRLDGIDALETHYSAAGSTTHQPWPFARQAAAQLLTGLGFHGVRRDAQETVVEATPARAPGYLFTRGADLYGRCVALVGAGEAPGISGQRVHVTVPMLRRTLTIASFAGAWRIPPTHGHPGAGIRGHRAVDPTARTHRVRGALTGAPVR
jgi:hypothetical protein